MVTVGSAVAAESALALGVTKASLLAGGGALYSTGRQYATTGEVNGVEVIFDSGMTLVGGRVLLGGLGSGSQWMRGASKAAAVGLGVASVVQGAENFSEGIGEGNFARASLGLSEMAGGIAGVGSLLQSKRVVSVEGTDGKPAVRFDVDAEAGSGRIEHPVLVAPELLRHPPTHLRTALHMKCSCSLRILEGQERYISIERSRPWIGLVVRSRIRAGDGHTHSRGGNFGC